MRISWEMFGSTAYNYPGLFYCLVVILALIQVRFCGALTTKVTVTESRIPRSLGPHVGYARVQSNQQGSKHKRSVEFIVIGTSHFECQSAAEVSTLIERVQPDGVVIELDPERVLRLTKQDSMNEGTEIFGGDFLSAIDCAQRLDIPLFLGDESTQQTQQRFLDKLLLPQSYTPMHLLKAIFSMKTLDGRRQEDLSYVDLIQTFVKDPRKLLPIATTTLVPFIFLLGSIRHYELTNASSNVSTLLALVISFFAICKVFNSVIVDRDDILALRAANASKVISELKRKEAIRIRWKFSIDDDYVWNNPQESPQKIGLSGIPVFTLKTPLQKGMIRNLNLFEPRWLKMIDGITAANVNSRHKEEPPQFGCVSCTNKFYSAIQTASGKEGRYADIIFKRQGTVAQIMGDVDEGSRPSGARKVSVRIVGGDTFFIDNENELTVSDEGYIVAQRLDDGRHITGANATSADNKRMTGIADSSELNDDSVRIIVVVGLLHANGVIQRLSNKAT